MLFVVLTVKPNYSTMDYINARKCAGLFRSRELRFVVTSIQYR